MERNEDNGGIRNFKHMKMSPTHDIGDVTNPGHNNGHRHTHEDIDTVRRWFSYITLEGAFATVFIVLSGGAFLTGLALYWGADDFIIGLLAAVPFLAQIAQLFSAYLVNRTGKRKAITFWGIFAGRQMWWLLIPLLLFFDGSWRLGILIAVVMFSSVLVMIATPGWLSWMADLVPERIRGRYFGARSAIVSVATILSTIIGGIILDRFEAAGIGHIGFVVIIAGGCTGALIAIFLLKKLPAVQSDALKMKINLSSMLEPLRDKNYRRLLRIFVAWNFSIGISAAFFVPYMINHLKMNFTEISIYLSLASLAAILLNRPWGKIIDRFGSRPVIAFCTFGIVLVPLIWWLPTPGTIWILAFETVYSGSLWTGFNLGAFNIPIANSPKDKRIVYLSVFSVVSGLGFFVASIIGGAICQSISSFRWHIGYQTIVNYQIMFLISAVLRLSTAFMVLQFHEPREKRLPIMIQFMGYSVLKKLSVGRQLFPWALNKKEREEAPVI